MDDENEGAAVSSATEAISNQSEVQAESVVEVAALNPELVKSGEKAFKKCKSCHQIGDGAKNKTGPHLNAIFGRKIGGLEGFKYYSDGQAKISGRGILIYSNKPQ